MVQFHPHFLPPPILSLADLCAKGSPKPLLPCFRPRLQGAATQGAALSWGQWQWCTGSFFLRQGGRAGGQQGASTGKRDLHAATTVPCSPYSCSLQHRLEWGRSDSRALLHLGHPRTVAAVATEFPTHAPTPCPASPVSPASWGLQPHLTPIPPNGLTPFPQPCFTHIQPLV